MNRPIDFGIDSMITDHNELIKNLNQKFNNKHLFLIIHSMDRLIQDRKNLIKNFLLKLLVNVHNIHLIASVDVVNFEFLFTQNEINQLHLQMLPFNTYESYHVERNSILGNYGNELASKSLPKAVNISSIRYVYESLNDNAKKIFIIILKYFIENKPNKSVGLKFDQLYKICREEFLTSSVIATQQQLTEFKDHNLLKIKTGNEAGQTILLGFEIDLAKKFLDSIND